MTKSLLQRELDGSSSDDDDYLIFSAAQIVLTYSNAKVIGSYWELAKKNMDGKQIWGTLGDALIDHGCFFFPHMSFDYFTKHAAAFGS